LIDEPLMGGSLILGNAALAGRVLRDAPPPSRNRRRTWRRWLGRGNGLASAKQRVVARDSANVSRCLAQLPTAKRDAREFGSPAARIFPPAIATPYATRRNWTARSSGE
jgi:hypothetical protein